jgi:hypothetical protein
MNLRIKHAYCLKTAVLAAILSALPLSLARAQGYFKEDDPAAAIGLLVGVGVVILVMITINIIRHGMKHFRSAAPLSGKGGEGARMPMRQFSSFTLGSIARNYGLNKEQTKILEFVLAKDGVSNAKEAVSNMNTLDRHFNRAYNAMRRTIPKGGDDSAAQRQIYQLFSTRNAIESAPINASNTTAPRIEDGMDVVLGIHGKTYPLKVNRSKGQLITMLCPLTPLGEPIKLSKGTKVELSFFSDSSHGFLQNCQVLDVVKNSHEENMLQLITQGKVKTLFKRKNRRRQIKISCEFRVVTITTTGSGNRKQTKMIVANRKFLGEILDVSPGGCSIRTKGLLKPGLRIKIEFEMQGTNAALLGQILRINRGSSITSFVHVKFIKASLKALNVINALVYRYNEN